MQCYLTWNLTPASDLRSGTAAVGSAQVTLRDKAGAPVASADFYYERGRVVFFVGGSPHYLDYVQSADERKRRQLKALGYRVVVVEAAAIEKGLNDRVG